MKSKKFTPLTILLMLVMVLTLSFAAVACGRKDKETVDAGMFYCDSDDQNTYFITFSGEKGVSMHVKTTNASGTYKLESGKFKFDFDEKVSASIEATYADDVISLTYDGASMRFLRHKNYTVTYNAAGGSEVASGSVLNGKSAEKPSDPVRAGYAFIGWYTDEECTTAFSFAQPVLSDITLYAKWSEKMNGSAVYTVDFDLGYAAEKTYDDIATVNGKIYNVPTPERDGYTFKGWWYSDYESAEKLTSRYEEDHVFTANTTLFAIWESTAASSKLANPLPRIEGDIIAWDQVEGVSTYFVTVTDPNGAVLISQRIGATSVNAKFSSATAGEYVITVQAVATSEANNSDVTVRHYNNKALDRVSLFRIVEPSVLVFNAVDNAEKYKIDVVCGNPGHQHSNFDNGTSTYFNFDSCEMKEGGIAFTVTAYATGYSASTSETFYFNRILSKVETFYFDDSNEVVSWDAVEGAVDYIVKVTCGGKTDTFLSGGKTNVGIKNYSGSDITVSVVPTTKGYNSPAAGEYTYQRTRLNVPTNVKIENSVITWDAVQNAASYKVSIGGHEYTAVGTQFDLSGVTMLNGVDYKIMVKAEGANASVWSDPITAQYLSMSPAVNYAQGKVTWKPVVGAASYQVMVNEGATKTYAAGITEAPVEFTQKGINTISVRFIDAAEEKYEWTTISVYAYETVFDTREGSKLDNAYYAIGDIMDLPTPTRAGFNFNGWYNVPGAAQANGSKVENGSRFSALGDVIVYANWSPKSYTITYSVGTGESVDKATDAVHYTQGFKLAVPTTEDTTKTFIGWSDAPGGMGVQYTDSNGDSLFNWTYQNDITLYPMWANIFTFTLQTEGEYKDTYSVDIGREANKVSRLRVPETYNNKPVTIVEGYAFYRRSSLKVIEIPDTIKIIYSDTAFEECSNVEEVNIYATGHTNAPAYSSSDGVLFYESEVVNEGKSLVFIPYAKTGNYVIPSDVTTIALRAFSNSRLTSVVIPSSVTKIEDRAFYNCEHMTDVIFSQDEGDDLTIGSEAFANCAALRSFTVPPRWKEINIEDVFSGSNNFENIYVADDHEIYSSIEGMLCNKRGDTLLYCPVAKRGALRIPNGIRTIGKGAFANCNRFYSVTIPSYVTKIEDGAFENCLGLTSIVFDGGNTLGEPLSVGARAFAGCTSVNTIEFRNNSNLVSVGDYAFEGINKLVSIELPATLREVPGGLFLGCKNLVTVSVHADNPYLASKDGVLFDKDFTEIKYYSNNLTAKEYVLPETVTTIGNSVFEDNVNLEKIVIGNKLAKIGDRAFANCVNLETVLFIKGGEGHYTIGDEAFYGCASLSVLALAEEATAEEEDLEDGLPINLDSIGSYAFYKTTVYNLVLPEGLTSIAAYSLSEAGVSSVTIPASLKEIGDYAFYQSSLFSVDFAEGSQLERIGDFAFANTSIMSFTVPNTVTYIGSNAFQQAGLYMGFSFEEGGDAPLDLGICIFGESCRGIRMLQLPARLNSVAYDNPWAGYDGSFSWSSFHGLMQLGSFTMENGGNNRYAVVDGVLYEKNEAGDPVKAVYAAANLEAPVTIPKTVTLVCDSAFMYSTVPSITFEKGGTEDLVIGAYAFASTQALNTIEIPARTTKLGASVLNGSPAEITFETGSRLTEIGASVFSQMGMMVGYDELTWNPITVGAESITLPAGIKSIGEWAFNRSTSLKQVILPEGVESIGSYAFDSCSSLESITIPASVKVIGDSAFCATGLKSVTFAEGSQLEIIGHYTFNRCKSLVSITLPKGLKGDGVVDGMLAPGLFSYIGNSLKEVIFEDGCPYITSFGQGVFAGCTDMDKLALPVNLETIEGYDDPYSGLWGDFSANEFTLSKAIKEEGVSKLASVFAGVTNVKVAADSDNVIMDSDGVIYSKDGTQLLYYPAARENASYTVKDGVKTIGAYAFFAHKKIKTVVLPESLVTIGDRAFGTGMDDCDAGRWPSIESIAIPKNVTSIGQYAFYGCGNLNSVTFAEGSQLRSLGAQSFYSCVSLTEIALPDSLTKLGEAIEPGYPQEVMMCASVFYGCESLEKVTLSANLRQITGWSFGMCPSLSEVIVPEESILEKIDAFAFCYDMSLPGVNFTNAKNLSVIEQSVFQYCMSMTAVEFNSSSAISIGDSAFANTGLKSVTLPLYTRNIGNSAFRGVRTLTSVELPEAIRLESIGDYAFANTALTSVALENAIRLKSIGAHAFEGTGLAKVAFSDSVLSIGDYAFCGIATLGEVTLPRLASYIGAHSFEGTALTEITVYGSDAKIGDYAFAECSNLSNIILSSGVIEIGNLAFANTAITTISLPDTVNSLNANPFAGCNLTNIEVRSQSADLLFKNNALFNKHSTMIYYTSPTTTGAYVVPETVTTIFPGAFAGTKITSIEIPSSITVIDDGTFKGCTELTSITIGKNVTKVGASAFEGCTKLETVTFEKGGTQKLSIGEAAFKGCNKITTVEIPHRVRNSMEEREEEIFPGWSDTNYYYYAGIGASAFEGCSSLQTVTFEERPTNVNTSAYEDIYARTLLFMGPAVFKDCTSLESIHFPAHLTEKWSAGDNVHFDGMVIPAYAFENCVNLTTITFDPLMGVVAPGTENEYQQCSDHIGSYAFKGCTKLTSLTLPKAISVLDDYAFAESCFTTIELNAIIIEASYGDREEALAIGSYCFADCANLETFICHAQIGGGQYVLPQNVSTGAFKNCTKLKSVTFDKVAGVDAKAFEGCTALEEVNMAFYQSMVYGTTGALGADCFKGCSNITTLNITGYLTAIRDGAFSGLTKVTAYTLPASVKEVGAKAFEGWTSAQTITAPFAEDKTPKKFAEGWAAGATVVYDPTLAPAQGEEDDEGDYDDEDWDFGGGEIIEGGGSLGGGSLIPMG